MILIIIVINLVVMHCITDLMKIIRIIEDFNFQTLIRDLKDK